jgi:hypothetical protein
VSFRNHRLATTSSFTPAQVTSRVGRRSPLNPASEADYFGSSATLRVRVVDRSENVEFQFFSFRSVPGYRGRPFLQRSFSTTSGVINMPVTIPPADLHATSLRSTHHQGHQRLRDEEDPVELAPHLTNTGYTEHKFEAEGNSSKYGAVEGQKDDEYRGKVDEEKQSYDTGIKGRSQRLMQVLVKHGVEARATEPVPEEVSPILPYQLAVLMCPSLPRNEPNSSGGLSSRNSLFGPPQTPISSVSLPASWDPTCSVLISTRVSGLSSSSMSCRHCLLRTLRRLVRFLG